jgi:glutamate-1-semialdehyde aminotransferase
MGNAEHCNYLTRREKTYRRKPKNGTRGSRKVLKMTEEEQRKISADVYAHVTSIYVTIPVSEIEAMKARIAEFDELLQAMLDNGVAGLWHERMRATLKSAPSEPKPPA